MAKRKAKVSKTSVVIIILSVVGVACSAAAGEILRYYKEVREHLK